MRLGKRGKLPDDLPVHRGAFRIQLVPRVDGRRMHVFNRADGMNGAAGLAMGAVGRALGFDYPEHDGPRRGIRRNVTTTTQLSVRISGPVCNEFA